VDTTLTGLRRRLAEPPAPAVRRIDAWLLGGAALALLMAGALVGAAQWAVRPVDPPTPDLAHVRFMGRELVLPGDWLRSGVSAEALELTASAARLAPGAPGRLFVTVLRAGDDVLPPADRPARLYARFLSPAATPTAGGLIRREFRSGTPYEGETLYVAGPDGRSFAARCAPATPGALPETCLSEMRIDGFDVRLRLAPDALAYWRAVVEGLRAVLGRKAAG